MMSQQEREDFLRSEWRRMMLHIAVVLVEACALAGQEHMEALTKDWHATSAKLKELALLMPEPPA